MIALQLVGSPTSEFFYNLSLLYAKEVVQPHGFDLTFVTAHPDGTWSVSKTLDNNTKKLSLTEMIAEVKSADLAVPHMFCHKGLTSIRTLFEDILNIPLVGSSGQSVSLTQNKFVTKTICKTAGIQVPDGCLFKISEQNSETKNFEFPVIVKPNNADNSDGLSLVKNSDKLNKALEKGFRFDDEVLVEEYIPGREIRGAVIELGGTFRTLPFIEYKVHHENPIRYAQDKLKFDEKGNLVSQSDKKQIPAECPAKLSNDLKFQLSELMIIAHKALKCRDFSMFDFRIHQDTIQPYLLEAGLFWSFSKTSMISNMLSAENENLIEMTERIWNQAKLR